jgi:hypothetical protein
MDERVLEKSDAVICLNGAGIGDKRWSEDRKRVLLSSRVDAVGCIAKTLAAMDDPPGTFVSASAIGIYGDTGESVVDESRGPGKDFLSELCVAWESAADPARDAGVRVVHPRTGIVLASNGGALSPLLPIFKLGLGGPIGSGRQWWSWITIADEVAAFLFLIDGNVSGPVNLVAPHPVRQKEFAEALGAQIHRPAVLRAPRFAVNIRLGKELASTVGYASQRVKPAVLCEAGFVFRSPRLEGALKDVFDSAH